MKRKLKTVYLSVFTLLMICTCLLGSRGTYLKIPDKYSSLVDIKLSFPDAPYFIDEWYPVEFKVINRSNKSLHVYSNMPIIYEFNNRIEKHNYIVGDRNVPNWNYSLDNRLDYLTETEITTIAPGQEQVFNTQRDLFTHGLSHTTVNTSLDSERIRFMVSANECAASNWASISFSSLKILDEPVLFYGLTTQGTPIDDSKFRLCVLGERRFLFHMQRRVCEIPMDKEPRFTNDAPNSLLSIFTGNSDVDPIIWNTRMVRLEKRSQQVGRENGKKVK